MAPDHAPDAVHAVALLENHVKVELPPLDTLIGLALRETSGRTPATVTMVDCDAEPPDPVQVRVNVVVFAIARVLNEPLVGSDPLQPPDAAQLCASIALHCSVTE